MKKSSNNNRANATINLFQMVLKHEECDFVTNFEKFPNNNSTFN